MLCYGLMKRDVLIVGGGVIGCSIALKLAEAGCKVTVVERGRIGCEASRAAAGMLSPQADSLQPDEFFAFGLKSRSMYKDFVAHLQERSGIDAQLREEGALFVSIENLKDHADSWTSWQIEAGLKLEEITAAELFKLEPAVTKAARRAFFIPDDHQVDNRLLMDALSIAIKRAGVEVLEGVEVTALLVNEERAQGLLCGDQQMHAGAVLLAAGSWSGKLLESVGLKAKTIPARGQMIAVRSSAIRHVLHSSEVYLVPRNDGRLLIGATIEYAGFEKANTAKGLHSLLDAALALAPEISSAEIVETWSGLRPDTIDHLPILGQTSIENLWLATGHFRNGILLAPATAELIARSILKGRDEDEVKPFSALRFEASQGIKPTNFSTPSDLCYR
jgi:glycine oxidase